MDIKPCERHLYLFCRCVEFQSGRHGVYAEEKDGKLLLFSEPRRVPLNGYYGFSDGKDFYINLGKYAGDNLFTDEKMLTPEPEIWENYKKSPGDIPARKATLNALYEKKK